MFPTVSPTVAGIVAGATRRKVAVGVVRRHRCPKGRDHVSVFYVTSVCIPVMFVVRNTL